MGRRFSDSAGIRFAITPLSGYTAGPLTIAALIKRGNTAMTEGMFYIHTSAFAMRLFFTDGVRLVTGSDTGTKNMSATSTSIWYLAAVTWAGGAAVPRFHLHNGTSWAHADRDTGTNSSQTIAGTDQLHVGYSTSGSGSFDVVCSGFKKSDRTDGQIETLSPLYFQTWRDFAFDWLIGFDASLTTAGAYQDQASPGTGDEISKTGTTAVGDPAGFAWTGSPAAATNSGFLAFV